MFTRNSLLAHRAWKRRMARRVLTLGWRDMIDVAAGTGDIALRVARGLKAGTAAASSSPTSASRAGSIIRRDDT